jgi:DNA-binding response OmpR family regulator
MASQDHTLHIQFAGEQEFLEQYRSHLAEGRVLVDPSSVPGPGSVVRVQLALPVKGYVLEIQGRVEESAGPGATVVFENVDERSWRDIEACARFVEKRRGRVLVVDDDIPFGELMAQVLEEQDIGVLTASTPIPALSVLRDTPVDLIITDIVMPRMDGLEFADTVRQLPLAEHTPILFVSGADLDEGEWAAARRLGDGVLEKPMDIDDFARRVKTLIDVGSTRRPKPSHPGVEVKRLSQEEVDRRLRLAEIAEGRLQRLGARTWRSDDRLQVYGEIALPGIQQPFDQSPIAMCAFLAIGHDRVQFTTPRFLSELDAIPFLDFVEATDMAAALRGIIEERERNCMAALRRLQALGLKTRTDSDGFCVLAQRQVSGDKVLLKAVQPGRITMVAINGVSLGDVMSDEERTLELADVESGLELEMDLDTLRQRARARIQVES